MNLLPHTYGAADQTAVEWELTIRGFTILEAAGQDITHKVMLEKTKS